jgi:hypothetical protein
MRIRRFSSSSPARIRVLATLMLGFQAFLWGGGSIVEAHAAAESLTRNSHIEDQGATKCPPIHSHLDCVICRTMSGAGVGGSAPALVPIATHNAERPVSDRVTPASVGFSGPLGSRAPPGRPIRGPVA